MRIGYARVSTKEQDLGLQLDALKAAGCTHIYEEKASGKTLKGRAELEHAVKALRAGDEFVVWKLDRLGRNLGEIALLMGELTDRGVTIVSVTDRIDTGGSMGKAFAHLALVFAELERELLSERTRAGLAAARARGRLGGRKKALTDKQVGHLKLLMADPSTSPTELAKEYGISRSTLYKYVGARGPDSLTPAQLNAMAVSAARAARDPKPAPTRPAGAPPKPRRPAAEGEN